MKKTIILIAEVKYPSSNNTYLSANSYVIENIHDYDELEKAEQNFKSYIEVDGFKIVNMLCYIVPEEHIKR